MSDVATTDWLERNRLHLMGELDAVRAALARHAGDGNADEPTRAEELPAGASTALEGLTAQFGLSRFERALLVTCAGVELDGDFAALVRRAHGGSGPGQPTFSLALAALPEPHWSALTPAAPLRRWQLVELGAGETLVHSPLRISERVLHYLVGIEQLDEGLAGYLQPLAPGAEPVASQRAHADTLVRLWSPAHGGALPVVGLSGPPGSGRRAIAAAACARLGLGLYELPAALLPTGAHELDILMRLLEREAALSGSALLLDLDAHDSSETAREAQVARLINQLGAPLILLSRHRREGGRRELQSLDVARPTRAEQRDLWAAGIDEDAGALNGRLDALVAQFDLGPAAIVAACRRARALDAGGDGALWEAARHTARPRLDDLAQRIEPVATWDELVLPERHLETLREIALQVRGRSRVYEAWGFAARSSRGLGISALFAGPSGTGKTMAAEVLANELRLDLYRIDLSQVVSKYIGETEKNLSRVFDAAESGGAILLFDEADALFGKRSEVKDSHDRYANIEIGYLLQRMEAYRGLAILTTNRKSALDEAFARRIRFVVNFPFPDAAQRAAIWRGIFPAGTPVEGLDPERLARLNVAGGNIRNIALNAAFLAADAGEPVGMGYLRRAARSEYAKLEKPFTDLPEEPTP